MESVAWRERWIAWRNRRLSDPAFQTWAASFPLTRGVARRRAGDLFDVAAGFVYSQTLATCVELGLLELLREGPLATDAVAGALDLPVEATDRLLGAAAALRLVDRTGPARFALGPQGAALLGNAGLTDMIAHHRHLYADLADGPALLRRGRGSLAGYWPYATSDAPDRACAGAVESYSALMAASQPRVAADVLDAYPIRGRRRVLDVGGGAGVFLAEAARRAPQLQLMLFDLPAVTERARKTFAREGIADRAEIFAGDFLTQPLPRGADLITLIRILHDHDDAGVATLLRSARAALPDDGALLIAEPMSAAPRPDRVSDAYFGLYLHAMGRGRARTPADLIARLKVAGFRRFRRLRTRSPFLLRAILARP